MMSPEDRERYRALKTPYPEKMLPKWRIVLDALLAGMTIELGGIPLRAAMDDFEDTPPYMLGQEVTIQKHGEPETKGFVIIDPPISWLIAQSDKLCTEEIVSIGADSTLRHMANERIRKREKSLQQKRRKKVRVTA